MGKGDKSLKMHRIEAQKKKKAREQRAKDEAKKGRRRKA